MQEKKKKKRAAKIGKRLVEMPAILPIHQPGVLPQWMYGDPADVAERVEAGVIRTEERRQQKLRQHSVTFGLVSERTVRLIKQTRIRELVAGVLGKKR